MAIHCDDVESLVQTHLDGELAEEDVRVLTMHLGVCGSCSALAAGEARFHAELRAALRPPAAPAGLADRLATELAREDRRARKAWGARWGAALPVTASLAAAAALLLFVASNRGGSEPQLAYEAVRQHMRRPPIEVQGAAVSPWVQRHLSPSVQIPRFSDQSTQVRGARLSHLRGRDAVQVFYDASIGYRRHEVSAIIVDATDLDLRGGRRTIVEGRELWVGTSRGYSVVTHKDAGGMGYIFTSDMDESELLAFVNHSDLLLRASRGGPWSVP